LGRRHGLSDGRLVAVKLGAFQKTVSRIQGVRDAFDGGAFGCGAAAGFAAGGDGFRRGCRHETNLVGTKTNRRMLHAVTEGNGGAFQERIPDAANAGGRR